MAYCKNIINIDPADFLGDSLFKINTNWSNLDLSICSLSADIRKLRGFIRSLDARLSPTVSLTFVATNTEYNLLGNVRDDSLGSIKFGDDIPLSTQKFLTAAKVENLIDAEIFEPKNENALRWNGTKWENSPLTDEVGAEFLYQLKDCTKISTNVLSGQILLYNSSLSSWINVTDRNTGRVLSGDYGDITVDVSFLKWDINPGAITDKELATNSVTVSTIGNLQVTNNSFANNTITQSKFNSINFGEINTGINKGSGIGVCIETNNSSGAIPLKSIKGVGCQISSNNREITITAQTPPPPVSPTGGNLGTGAKILREPITESDGTVTYGLKTLRAGSDAFGTKSLNITEDNSEITINRITILGVTILGVEQGGGALSDSAIKTRVAAIFPPSAFPKNTICNVNIETPSVTNYTTIPVIVPFTLSYEYANKTYTVYPTNCIKSCPPPITYKRMLLKWLDPVQGPEGRASTLSISPPLPPQPVYGPDPGPDFESTAIPLNFTIKEDESGNEVGISLLAPTPDRFSPEKTVVATHVVATNDQPKLVATNRMLTLVKTGNSWV